MPFSSSIAPLNAIAARRGRRALAAAVALCAASLGRPKPAGAQVNVETLRNDLAEEGFGLKVNASLTTYAGNNEGTSLGGSMLLGISGGRHLGYLSANGLYTRLGGTIQVAKSFAHVRYNYQLVDRVWGEAFVQAEADRFRRLTLRQLFGLGPRVALIDAKTAALYVGLLHLVEFNRLQSGREPVRPDWVQRLGSYASFVGTYEAAHATFTTTLYYQPRYDDFRDWRMLWVNSLEFSLGRVVTTGLNVTFRHESPVAQDLEQDDLTFVNTFGVQL